MITYNILITIYIVISVLMFIRIINRDTIFGVTYGLLIIYSAFPMIGYVNYPKMYAIKTKQYYGLAAFPRFYIYMVVFMLFCYWFWKLFFKAKTKNVLAILKIKPNKSIFYFICIIHLLFNVVMLLKTWSNLTYRSQTILKGNRLWLFSFITLGIMILLFVTEIIDIKEKKHKIPRSIIMLLLIYSVLLVIISTKAGQRMELFMTFVGIVAILFEKHKNNNLSTALYTERKKNYMSYIIIISIVVFVITRAIYISRASRIEIGITDTIASSITSLTDLSLEFLVFQDWVTPAMSLMTCMQHNIISPKSVFAANIGNVFSFITKGSVSLPSIVREYFDKSGSAGYGFFYPTEGFMICGALGCILSAFILTLGFSFYRNHLGNNRGREFKELSVGVFSYYSVNLVRGHSVFFVKGFLYYYVFALIMYSLFKQEYDNMDDI